MELNTHRAISWPNHMRRNRLMCRDFTWLYKRTPDRFCPELTTYCPEPDNLLINFDRIVKLYGNLPG
jgi:hypothetical protein